MLRFAPSPTGDLHIGNLRVALINYILSRQKDEDFIIRIEDTDESRNIEGKDKEIIEILKKFAIDTSNIIYQSQNLNIHQTLALQLLKEKKAFACFCDEDELQEQRERAKREKRAYRYSGRCLELSNEEISKLKEQNKSFTIRVKKPSSAIIFNDLIKGEIKREPNDIDSFVILRANGKPTYNFACAVDDMSMDISLVVRGEDHLSNTPKQIHIQNLLGFNKKIEYAHLPIILNKDGKKMSKRDKASSVKWLLEEGFLPDAIINYLLSLGYNPPKEIFYLPDAIKWFDISKISKSPAKFDIDQLRYLNRQHLKLMDSKELSKIFGFADKDIGELLKIYLEEASTIKELEEKLKAIFSKKECNNNWGESMKKLASIIKEAPMIDDFNEFKRYLMKKSNLKGKEFFKPLRLLLTGSEHGPELKEIYPKIKPYLLEVAQCQS
ncbi:MAG: glutamate--tRNA ligase [Epsilonproteobacteria bacterium]|nr:glutamate--tRNA ligase [Campylobacterota bacterium]